MPPAFFQSIRLEKQKKKKTLTYLAPLCVIFHDVCQFKKNQ